MQHDPLLAPIREATTKQFGGLTIDLGQLGAARVQRIVYPTGWRWSTNVRQLVGTDRCRHGHAGFLARGRLGASFADGSTVEHAAPAFVVIEPGHDLWVLGDDEAVFIQFDFGPETIERLGLGPH